MPRYRAAHLRENFYLRYKNHRFAFTITITDKIRQLSISHTRFDIPIRSSQFEILFFFSFFTKIDYNFTQT